MLAVVLAIGIAACGGAATQPASARDRDDDTGNGPFAASREFTPKSFTARVVGAGRPMIFIPGLGCPGEVWDDAIGRLPAGNAAHVITLAGFAGQPPIKGALAATVRKELIRYIRSHHLDKPIVVGHSQGGVIAYWLAATAPELIGGAIIVDAGPALADTDVATANALRNVWAQAGDDELEPQVRAAFGSMVGDPKRIEPFIAAIARSDRHAMGDAIYELVRTDLRPQLAAISKPVLVVLADGSYQQRYKSDVAPIRDHQVVVIPNAHHFVMLDQPIAFARAVADFLAAHPAR